MDRRRTLVEAAVAGIFASSLAMAACEASGRAPPVVVPLQPAQPAATVAPVAASEPDPEPLATPTFAHEHACKGQNDCKGLGGCRTDKHDCKGNNDCKGQGGCRVASPANDKQSCKGEGGCRS